MTHQGDSSGDTKMRTTLTRIIDFFLAVDSIVSTVLFEIGDAIRRGWSAYTSFLERFRVKGFRRFVVDILDDAATFALAFAFILVAFALPPFSGEGDVWNKNRQYAVTITDMEGNIIGRRGIRQDDAVPLEEIPPHVIKALLATEDSRFYDHFGVDIVGTLRAAIANARAQGVVQGGSTLTQQLAKNLFLTPERSFRRKIHEAFLALWIEARLSKDEILKMYLDRSYMGAGNYGIEAASQYYFGKSVRDVNLREAAILAGLFKAPSKYAPHRNREAALARANVVLYRMLDAGFISYGELLEARRQPVSFADERDDYAPDHFMDWVYRETIDTLREHGLNSDFVVEVKTTVDTKLQRFAQELINTTLENEGRAYHAGQAALVSLTPDGAVKAIVGGKDYESSQFNRATDALRQPGSAFKPFVYLAALLKGYTPRTVISDAPITIGRWTPQNYSRRYHGKVTLTTALAHSYNTVPVRLMTRIGRKFIIETAHRVGLRSKLRPVPSLPLGSNEVTVLDITAAYAAFANGGKRIRPYTVLEIRRPDGTLIYSRAKNGPKPVQAVPYEKIAELNTMLNRVVVAGTARRAMLGFTPQAGKTGTTQNYRDAWFIGYTGHLVTGIWFGNDDYSPTRRMTGGSVPALTWKRFMLKALENADPAPLPGVPLNDQYVKAARKMRTASASSGASAAAASEANGADLATALTSIGDEDILIAPVPRRIAAGQAQPATRASGSYVRNLRNGGAKVRSRPRRKRKKDPLIGTLRNMFTIFRTDDRKRRVATKKSGTSRAKRKKRAKKNIRKTRDFWSLFR